MKMQKIGNTHCRKVTLLLMHVCKKMTHSGKKPHYNIYMYTNITFTDTNRANEDTNMTDSSGLKHLEYKIKQISHIKPLKPHLRQVSHTNMYTYTL